MRDASVVEDVTSRYDNYHHGLEHAAQAEVIPADFLNRFCVIGSNDQIKAKLTELESIGVDQFNIYLMTHGQEETLKAYGDEVIPQFSSVAV